MIHISSCNIIIYYVMCGGRESDYCKAREEGEESVREGGTEEGGGEKGEGGMIYNTPIPCTYVRPTV